MVFKNKLVLTLILSGLLFVDLNASEQRYVISEADGRTFLIDTETGSVWRYYFNKVNDQGWQRSMFYVSSDDTNEQVQFYPYADIFNIPKR